MSQIPDVAAAKCINHVCYGCGGCELKTVTPPCETVARETVIAKLVSISDKIRHDQCLTIAAFFRLDIGVATGDAARWDMLRKISAFLRDASPADLAVCLVVLNEIKN